MESKLYATKIAFLVSFVTNTCSFATVLEVLLGMLVLGGSLSMKVLGLDHDVEVLDGGLVMKAKSLALDAELVLVNIPELCA